MGLGEDFSTAFYGSVRNKNILSRNEQAPYLYVRLDDTPSINKPKKYLEFNTDILKYISTVHIENKLGLLSPEIVFTIYPTLDAWPKYANYILDDQKDNIRIV